MKKIIKYKGRYYNIENNELYYIIDLEETLIDFHYYQAIRLKEYKNDKAHLGLFHPYKASINFSYFVIKHFIEISLELKLL